jgi:hypothetical protein
LRHSPTQTSSIFRSSVKIKPFVTVLEFPRLLARLSLFDLKIKKIEGRLGYKLLKIGELSIENPLW